MYLINRVDVSLGSQEALDYRDMTMDRCFDESSVSYLKKEYHKKEHEINHPERRDI